MKSIVATETTTEIALSFEADQQYEGHPDDIDFTSASVFPFVYGTVWHGLVERGDIKAADKVLMLGGGIGQAGCEVAKALGAHVVAGQRRAAPSRREIFPCESFPIVTLSNHHEKKS
jgi:NADPH:quinone reductase-like Zn-dependent oxidoreductase